MRYLKPSRSKEPPQVAKEVFTGVLSHMQNYNQTDLDPEKDSDAAVTRIQDDDCRTIKSNAAAASNPSELSNRSHGDRANQPACTKINNYQLLLV